MLNRVQLLGRLGDDPEVRTFQDGSKVVNMRVATTEKWKDKQTGEMKEATEWSSITIYGDGLCKIAEKYLRKGNKVYLEGKLRTRKWQDQNGNDRYTTEVLVAGTVGLLRLIDGPPDGQRGGRAGSDQASGGAGTHGDSEYRRSEQQRGGFDDDLDDDVPF